MPKYEVKIRVEVIAVYKVEASTPKEAEQKTYDGDADRYDWQTEGKLESIKEVR